MSMKFGLNLEAEFLRAELLDHSAPGDIKTFLHAVFWASVEHLRARVMIDIRAPEPLFTSVRDENFRYVRRIAWYRTNRIALVGNVLAPGVAASDIEALARKQGVILRSFDNEQQALEWFRDRRKFNRRHELLRQKARALEHGRHRAGVAASDRRAVTDRRHPEAGMASVSRVN